MKRSRQCISGNPDNFTVSISFEYELERLVAVLTSIDVCATEIIDYYAAFTRMFNTYRKRIENACSVHTSTN